MRAAATMIHSRYSRETPTHQERDETPLDLLAAMRWVPPPLHPGSAAFRNATCLEKINSAMGPSDCRCLGTNGQRVVDVFGTPTVAAEHCADSTYVRCYSVQCLAVFTPGPGGTC